MNFTDRDGLSSNSILDIIQDKEGFIWLGTEDGLNKYDGYGFKAYRHSEDDTLSLSANYVNYLQIDSFDGIWMRSYAGHLSRMNLATEKVQRFDNFLLFPEIRNDNVKDYLVDSNGNLWVTDSETNLWKCAIVPLADQNVVLKLIQKWEFEKQELNLANTRWLCEDTDKNIWLYDETGKVWRYVPEEVHANEQFVLLDSKLFSTGIDGAIRGSEMVMDNDHTYWTRFGNHIVHFDLISGVIAKWEFEPGALRGQFIIHGNDVWLGGSDGLYHIARDTGILNRTNSLSGMKGSAAIGLVNDIFIDQEGSLWIGAFTGAGYFNRNERKFRHFKNEAQSAASLMINKIRSMATTVDHQVWLGTDTYGLVRFDQRKLEYLPLPNLEFFAQLKNKEIGIRAILPESNETTLWIGYSKYGIVNYDYSNQFIKLYHPDKENPNASGNYSIGAMAHGQQNDIWIATSGIDRFSKQSGSFAHFTFEEIIGLEEIGANDIRSLAIDNYGTLWAGTNGAGLLKLNYNYADSSIVGKQFLIASKEKIEIGPNWVNTICISTKDIVWFGTYGAGLLRLDPATEEIKKYTTRNGLPNNIVYGILEDERGKLWISTNYGICSFDVTTETFANYTPSDGLQGFEFNSGSYCKDNNGWMYFGGTNGWNCFHPDSIRKNTFEGNVVFTDFQLFNQSQIAGSSVMPFSINYTHSIVLTPEQSTFSFEFVLLNYTATEKNTYRYQLLGYDDGWQHTGTRRFITFTNLDPGEYTLRVQGANNDGLWSNQIREMQIIILPAYYQTIWFKILSVLLIVALLFLILLMRERIKNKQRTFEREQEDQLNRFLHDEVKNKMSRVIGTIASAKMDLEQNTFTRLNDKLNFAETALSNVSQSVRSLSHLYATQNKNLSGLSEEMAELIHRSIPKTIRIDISHPADSTADIELNSFKRTNFFLIFQESLLNAVHHSGCSFISIKWWLDGKMLNLEINDNGNGFDPDEKKNSVGLRNMKKRAAETQAILKIISQPGRGTMVRLTMPGT
ncbi:MAG: two-component regulator propeller domain-containing protein [Flavobacteriales bacterium]